MKSKTIKPDQLSGAMMDLLSEYGDDIYDTLEIAAKETARKAVSELKRVSPGEFARMWRHSAKKSGRVFYQETIHNKKYQLTHLLEKPHKTGKGNGQYPKKKGSSTDHTGKIARVEKKYVDAFIRILEKKL